MFLSTLPIACLSWMLCCFHASMVSQQFSLKGLGDIFCIFIQPFNVSPLYCPCSNRFGKILQNGAYFLDRLLKAKKKPWCLSSRHQDVPTCLCTPQRWNSSFATCGCRDSYDPAQPIKINKSHFRVDIPTILLSTGSVSCGVRGYCFASWPILPTMWHITRVEQRNFTVKS